MRLIIIIYGFLIFLGCSSPGKDSFVAPDSLKRNAIVNDTVKRSQIYKKFKAFKGDSLEYLRHNFIMGKNYYENKPLSKLLDDLELPILRYYSISGDPPHLEEIHGITLKFERDTDILRKYDAKQVPNTLIILLKDSISFKEFRPYLMRAQGLWTKELIDFFKDKRIKNIDMIHYPSSANHKDVKDLKKY